MRVIAGLLPKVVEAELDGQRRPYSGRRFCASVAMGQAGRTGNDGQFGPGPGALVYDTCPASREAFDGLKPLSLTLYFARLAQRLIAALTTATAAGTLYDVDMRLRPTGNKGPVAVSLKSVPAIIMPPKSWTWELHGADLGRGW